MSKAKIVIAMIIAALGVTVITTKAMAITWGQLKCMYANQNVAACHPIQTTTPEDNKNAG